MGTVRMTVAQALIRFLNNQYVEFDGKRQKFVKGVFTVFGHGNVLGIGQALEENRGGLDIHQGRNEQGMAHAAVAFAKQKLRRQIYACTSSVGPGAANMITAAATATANNIPVLLLPGDVFATRQPDPVLQQIEQTHDLSLSTNDAFRAVSKYWDRVSRPEQLMSAMINAMRVLTNPADTGAVTIALPQDVQAEAYDFPEYFFDPRVHRIERRQPAEDAVADAVKLIAASSRPMMICGGGVRYSEAAEALKLFAERFNIPFAETQAGRSAVEWTHPMNLGGLGVTGGPAANAIAAEADLVIGVGTRYTDFTTSSKRQFLNKNVRFISVNTSDFHAMKLDSVKVVADARAGLEAIAAELSKAGYSSSYTTEIKAAKKAWKDEMERLFRAEYTDSGFRPEVPGHLDGALPEYREALGSRLTQTGVLGELQKLLDEDAVVVGASGSLPGDLQRIWCPEKPETYHMEYGYSCMGYEIAGALGVKLAVPDREVYAMVGDGGYLMLHSELITSIQENKKINVLLFDNAGFGCINNLQMENGMGSFMTEFRRRNEKTGELDGGILSVDYAKCAEGYGAKTYKVTSMDELREAVADSRRQRVSTLIDIKVLPKTMTSGYEAWWNVGVAEVADKEKINAAYQEKRKKLADARQY